MLPESPIGNRLKRGLGDSVLSRDGGLVAAIDSVNPSNVFTPNLSHLISRQSGHRMKFSTHVGRDEISAQGDTIFIVVFAIACADMARVETRRRKALAAMKTTRLRPLSVAQKVADAMDKFSSATIGRVQNSVTKGANAKGPNPAFIIVAGGNNADKIVVVGFSGRLDVCHAPSIGHGARRPRCSNSRAFSILHEVRLSGPLRPVFS